VTRTTFCLLRGRRRGDAVVEFALIAPVLLLLLFGVTELGRVVDAWVVVHNGVREGARAGARTTNSSAAVVGSRRSTRASSRQSTVPEPSSFAPGAESTAFCVSELRES